MRNCNNMSNIDLSKIKSISDKIMRDVFDDKGIVGVQAKRNLRESSSYEEVICNLGTHKRKTIGGSISCPS